jgi:DNA-binding LytR/AlgR family response regulator
MPTALIADDEPIMRAALRDQLGALWPELQIIEEAGDGPEALRKIERSKPDIAFLDIRMPGMTGLQVAQSITAASRVVFVTAYDSHALEAFEANAVDYVLKPLETPRLARLVAKLSRNLQQSEFSIDGIIAAMQRSTATAVSARRAQLDWLQVAVGTRVRMVHADDVIYFEADAKYTRVVAEDCDGLIRTSLKELLEGLDSRVFLQTHRGIIVNRRFIHSVHRNGEAMEIELRGRPERLKVSLANHHLFRAM